VRDVLAGVGYFLEEFPEAENVLAGVLGEEKLEQVREARAQATRAGGDCGAFFGNCGDFIGDLFELLVDFGGLLDAILNFVVDWALIACNACNVEEWAWPEGCVGFEYRDDHTAPPTKTFSTSISGGNSTWRDYVRTGMANWSVTGANITEDVSSDNSTTIGSYGDGWYGLYDSWRLTYDFIFSRFEIFINQDTITEDATNLANFAISTATHEFGHSLRLIDNPSTIFRSIMKYSRNRNRLTSPTSYDKAWVEARETARASPVSNGSKNSSVQEELSYLIASYPEYIDINALTNSADIIISANAISSSMTFIDFGIESSLPYTISSIQVTEVIYGSVNVDDIIEVKQLGTIVSPEASTNYLEAEQNYLLFLSTSDGSPYFILNPVQGQYAVEQSGIVIAHPNNTIEVASVGALKEAVNQAIS